MKTYWRALQPCQLFLMGAALVPLVAGGQTPQIGTAPVSSANSVVKVEIGHSDQQTTVRVAGSGQLNYHVLRLSNPPRIVVDFDHTNLSVPRNAIPSSYEPVRGVRLGQSQPDQVRLVIDLDHPAPFSLQNGEQSVTVNFPDGGVDSASAPKPSAEKFPLSPALTDAKARLASPAPQAEANGTATTPVQVSQPAPGGSTQLSAALLQPQAQAQPAAAQGPYTGEPISVNLKDVDLKDFFRLIHEISGLNVVLDPSVKGTVTLVLDEVPWDQALDIVLRNNGLAKEVNGNVLRIATQDTLKHEAQDKADLSKAQSDAVDTVTTTRVLSYAKASDVRDTLKRFLSPRGDIFSDDRSNSLIIRDIPSAIPAMDNLIRQLDRKSQQVEIEARVVQASRGFARDIGTQFAFSTGFGNSVIGGNTTVGTSPITRTIPGVPSPALVVGGSPTTLPAAVSMPLSSNFPATAPTSGISYLFSSRNFALDYLITAAESKGVGKLLSSPQLVTQNNAKATVKQGTQVPIQTTINNTVSVQYVDAVLELQVTPQITADGTIFMDVLVQNTQIDNGIPLVQGIPALDTQSAQTKVLINDGGTIVIGGVMVTQQNTNIQQVPLVGSVPLIGHLFKRTTVNVSSQELLFFVTPRILPG